MHHYSEIQHVSIRRLRPPQSGAAFGGGEGEQLVEREREREKRHSPLEQDVRSFETKEEISHRSNFSSIKTDVSLIVRISRKSSTRYFFPFQFNSADFPSTLSTASLFECSMRFKYIKIDRVTRNASLRRNETSPPDDVPDESLEEHL